jgi:hypothetical protein
LREFLHQKSHIEGKSGNMVEHTGHHFVVPANEVALVGGLLPDYLQQKIADREAEESMDIGAMDEALETFEEPMLSKIGKR